MAISYQINVEGDLLNVVTKGFDENLEEISRYGQTVIEASLQNKCKYILADERDVEYRLGTVDIIDLVDVYSCFCPNVEKAAIIFNPKNVVDAKFWETVAVNRGLTVKVFKEKNDAIEWFNC